MKNTIKLLALLCATLILVSSLAACSAAKIDKELEINVTVLNGTTGFGAAKMISDSSEGKSELNYKFTVETDAANVTAGLINGSIDIAALPTNAAATVYNKTNGGIKIAAVNTLGVLSLIWNIDKASINSISDLDGMTVYCPAQNPAFIFKAICDASNINVTIDTSFAQPADLRTALVAGQVDVAVLPEPMVTIAQSANDRLSQFNLTPEWEKAYGENTLMQGCIVVRTEWAEAHPKELEQFLKDYAASIDFTMDNPKEASELIVSTGIFAGKAPVAEKAIPRCNIVYFDGETMANALSVFFEKLYAVNPAAVGGAIPDSGIYLEK
jgi:NitT/TauT family transport system substrate-binding protein